MNKLDELIKAFLNDLKRSKTVKDSSDKIDKALLGFLKRPKISSVKKYGNAMVTVNVQKRI